MKTTALLACAAVLPAALAIALPANAAGAPRTDAAILKLAPNARVEQRCNARAMGVIGREHRDLRPDELVAYAFADTLITGPTIRAPGAAVRSGGKWYRLSYTCTTRDDGVDIAAFQYTLGNVVPRADWDAHYLVP
ncbi:DUF930 domain-containing protein [Aquabacter cavernae]|uniref:DUF930 domain-containing protein n=1 Tax=Aquabacter cavernae TaxID=2496029 RepID=UPI001FDF63E3|nr:DUF930 domain-containing protein [Aquabacter cavernae]